MIGLTFTLAGCALLLLQVLAMDVLLCIRRHTEAFDADLGHDALVFPDHEHDTTP